MRDKCPLERIMESGVAAKKTSAYAVDVVSLVTGGKVTKQSSPFEEVVVVRHGLNVSTVNRLGTLMKWDKKLFAKYLHTTPKTLERHAKDRKTLNINISESALDIAKLTNLGIDYFGSVERWKLWLNAPNIQFNNAPPNSVLDTATGRELIRRVIRSLEYGFVA